jgi:hypothetical protein
VRVENQKTPKVETFGVFVRLVELLLEAGGFARAAAHEIQLGASDNVMALDDHFVNARGAEQERALHADAIAGHAADGKRGFVAAFAKANEDALKFLDALAFAFLDLDVYADGIPRAQGGDFLVDWGF